MVFFPACIALMRFKVFFAVSITFAMIYSFYRKKYFPMQRYSKTEKIVGAFFIISLFVRFVFL